MKSNASQHAEIKNQCCVLSFLILTGMMLSSCSLFSPKYKNLKEENDITSSAEMKKAAIRVEYTYKQNYLGGMYMIYSGYGSGVIFYENEKRYYALTNNHVIYTHSTSKVTYSVVDSDGNEHSCKIEKKSSSYDLAVVSFPKEDYQFNVVKLADQNPECGAYVSAIDQDFTITSGVILRYTKGKDLSTVLTQSCVRFDVITMTTYIHPGSSGGILYNKDYELAGVVYAEMEDYDGSFIEGYALPVEKVRYFLKNV